MGLTLFYYMSSKNVICGVYKITNPKGEVYIGQSAHILDRWSAHRGMRNHFERLLKDSLKMYGPDNHTFEIIEECDKSVKKLRERFWQEQYFLDGIIMLNLVMAKMDCFPTRLHPSTREIRVDATIKNHTGLKRSEESKENMRLSASYKSKPVKQFDKDMNLIAEYRSAHEAARNGFCRPRISGCCNGIDKTHKGYIWQYS